MSGQEKHPCAVRVAFFLPERLLQECLQHLRDFESKYPDPVLMIVQVAAPSVATKRIEEIFAAIKPPLDVAASFVGPSGEPN